MMRAWARWLREEQRGCEIKKRKGDGRRWGMGEMGWAIWCVPMDKPIRLSATTPLEFVCDFLQISHQRGLTEFHPTPAREKGPGMCQTTKLFHGE